MNARYAAGPTATVFKDDNGKRSRKKLHQLLWGDLLDLRDEPPGDWAKVGVRIDEGTKIHPGWMKKSDIQTEPVLEVTFVDIGQGDGCLLIAPDGHVSDDQRRAIVIDAGEKDNMNRYLRYRFFYPRKGKEKEIHAAVISHPDSDHYRGFDAIFNPSSYMKFKHVYHNGLVERKGDSVSGPTTGTKPKFFTDLVRSSARLRTLLAKDAKIKGRKLYPDMLRKGLKNKKFGSFKMLSRDDKHMPGFGPGSDVEIQVLGPVVEKRNGKKCLRDFGNTGFTKNGHSVVLRLVYGNVRMLLGGDLNIPSERLLLKSIMRKSVPEKASERAKYIKAARKKLEVDIAKSCHHGSADFSSLFLSAVNPIVTVISSGDAEAHSHPRAETLGAIGVTSRGERPLIFSTELARSAKDAIRNPREERRNLKDAHKAVLAAEKSHRLAKTAAKKKSAAKKKAQADKKFRKLVDETIQRTVQVYGAIYVRTDGENVVVAQRIERDKPGKQWDASQLTPDAKGVLQFISKFHGE